MIKFNLNRISHLSERLGCQNFDMCGSARTNPPSGQGFGTWNPEQPLVFSSTNKQTTDLSVKATEKTIERSVFGRLEHKPNFSVANRFDMRWSAQKERLTSN
jgi:hypothetical protein